jgi:hypothetical protein
MGIAERIAILKNPKIPDYDPHGHRAIMRLLRSDPEWQRREQQREMLRIANGDYLDGEFPNGAREANIPEASAEIHSKEKRRAMVERAGGPKLVSDKTGVDKSDLNKWINGKPLAKGLSEKVVRIEKHLATFV